MQGPWPKAAPETVYVCVCLCGDFSNKSHWKNTGFANQSWLVCVVLELMVQISPLLISQVPFSYAFLHKLAREDLGGFQFTFLCRNAGESVFFWIFAWKSDCICKPALHFLLKRGPCLHCTGCCWPCIMLAVKVIRWHVRTWCLYDCIQFRLVLCSKWCINVTRSNLVILLSWLWQWPATRVFIQMELRACMKKNRCDMWGVKLYCRFQSS